MTSRSLSFAALASILLALATPARAQDTAAPASDTAATPPETGTAPGSQETTEPESTSLAPSDAAQPMMMIPPPEREETSPPDDREPIEVVAPRPRAGRPHLLEATATVASFWDFFINARGAIALDPMVDLTVHATLWTNPELSRAGGDFWVETGAGARVLLLDSALWLGGEVGITHGSYLSDYSEGVPFDGIALRLYADLRLPIEPGVVGLDAYAMFAFYTALREGSSEAKNAFHTIARVGGILFDVVTVGAYYEHFYRQVRSETEFDETPALWLGGYVETRFDFGLVIGAAAGVDITPDVPSDESEFYRAWIGWRS